MLTTIPRYEKLFIPILKILNGSKTEIHRKDILDNLLTELKIDEKVLTNPAGKFNSGYDQISDRRTWALTTLKHAGCIDSSRRGYYFITKRGKELLSKGIDEINKLKLAELYPDVMDTAYFNSDLREIKEHTQSNLELIKQTPDEQLLEIIASKENEIYLQLTSELKKLSPRAFEHLVVKLLVAMGYGVEEFSKITQYTNDNGIDGIVQSDILGFEKIYIQAKKYEGNVGRPDIQKFVGAMTGTSKGVFITTSKFNTNVLEYINSRPEKVILIDGERLVKLMYIYNLGVNISETINFKSIDSDFFDGFD